MSVRDVLNGTRLLHRRMPFVLRMGIWGVVIYLSVVVVFSFLQRSMIYLPAREARIEPQDAGLPAGRVHTITLRTADDIELRGWHILADGRSAANQEECQRELSDRRLVLFFSGNGGNRTYRVEECQALSRLDANVFIFDYRGYGENPGSPSEENLAADALAIWQYANRERQVAADRIVIYGESLGGGVAVRLAAQLCQSGTVPAGLIVRSTFSSLVDVGSYHYPWLPVRLALQDRYASVDRLPQVTCSFLQIHGAQDTIVPLKFGQKLFAAAAAKSVTGIAKRFVELPGADHNDVLWVAQQPFESALAEFFNGI